MEPNLEELKDQAIADVPDCKGECEYCGCNETDERKTKVKLFRRVGANTDTVDVKTLLEQDINEFLATKETFWIDNVSFSVQKNFLPMTDRGEYQEVWYAMVQYSE